MNTFVVVLCTIPGSPWADCVDDDVTLVVLVLICDVDFLVVVVNGVVVTVVIGPPV